MDPYHDAGEHCFVLPLGDEPAVVNYRPRGEGRVTFEFVYVPPSQRGTDASRRLLAFAFDHARRAGWRVRPTCAYIAGRYLPRHPEYQDLIDDDSD